MATAASRFPTTPFDEQAALVTMVDGSSTSTGASGARRIRHGVGSSAGSSARTSCSMQTVQARWPTSTADPVATDGESAGAGPPASHHGCAGWRGRKIARGADGRVLAKYRRQNIGGNQRLRDRFGGACWPAGLGQPSCNKSLVMTWRLDLIQRPAPADPATSGGSATTRSDAPTGRTKAILRGARSGARWNLATSVTVRNEW